ncbi:MAG: YXWGXW repeat-containing protein [Glaciimonas sp.]|nr:YXWGXW repeat-containing protein [Glaciimonas sp.]
MKLKSILCVSLLAASTSMMLPMAQAQNYAQIQGHSQTQGYSQTQNYGNNATIRIAPPAPRYERVPPARAGYAWAPGYWNWAGRRHVWVQGTWVRARPGYRYSAPRWNRDRRGNWVFRAGDWRR